MTLISGVLKGPYGDPRSGVTITLRAVRTSSTVLSLAKSQSVTDDSGKYSLPVEAGAYEVIISVYGAQPERVGAIEVYNDSLPGTLNDFLSRPGKSDITPEIVQTVDRLRAEAALSADKSAKSAVAAKNSENNAAKIVDQLANSIDDRIVSTLWGKTRYAMPSQGVGVWWYQLGTVVTDQHGDTVVFDFNGGSGYNGNSDQTCSQRLIFRYGNRAVDTNVKGAASITLYTTGTRPILGSAAMIESARNTFDIYILVNAFVTSATYMVVDSRSPGQLAKVNVSFKKMSVSPVGTMDFIEYKIPVWDNKKQLPDYESVAKAFSNGFGGAGGPRISGVDVESQVTLMKTLRGHGSEIFRVGGGSKIGMPPDGSSIHLMCGDVSAVIAVDYNNGNVNTMTCNGTGLTAGIVKSNILWGTSNTTVDANGFIKKASPIARLSAAPEHMQADYLEGGFALAGCVAVNGEADGVSAERISTGVYQLKGSLGLAKEGWTIEVPQDVNGNRLCFVETATDSDGVITVKISKRRFDIDTATVVAGEAMDIPEGRWIDLRLSMPVREVVEVLPPEALVSNDDAPSETNAAS
ncbi:prophage tail fiber N-terminal domain-containing protein [Serratia surfactantfaciens]|uniref:Prophage tail fiber N-terminal domain-containing protein n=1 Tax=Serratia surfactantfaciens TaxID=2741499 RepID=A0ABS0M2L4_9GAMM|nr:prophage tail fiber N-terminal domain-containing protein [Serratia surfactantfaciens]MBH1921808.1 prophage tail fiber N-terminal domain-containing protein [Serratia surfactantfaciens]